MDDDVIRGACPGQVAIPWLPGMLGCRMRILPQNVLGEERHLSWDEALKVRLDPLLPGERFAPVPWAWAMPNKNSGRQWVIFGRKVGDTYNLFRVAIGSDRKLTSDPEQLTFTTGFSNSASVSENGRMGR